MVLGWRRLPVNVITSILTIRLPSQKFKRISSVGPELRAADSVDVMCSPGSEGHREEGTVEYVYCRGVVTELLKYGPTDLHAASKGPNPPKLLILVIPGNPGVVGFYKTYMWTLYQTFLRRYPVWAVSHAGHCMPPDTFDMIEDASVTEKEDVFGLDGQIEHKLAFLRKHVPRDTNLLLIGHSIGCYIILKMMKRDPELKVVKAVMLFPTIERMACSPQGKVMTPVLCRLRYAIYLPIFLLSLLPEKLKTSMVHLALRNLYVLDNSIIPATVSLINVDCAANGMYMGSQEMQLVVERDNLTIRQHLSKLIFYYGATDHWCPVQYYHDIRKDFPEGDIRLCERGIRHAFVLDAGEEVANMTAEWIYDDLRML
ncbi:lipid droplet-associated hydrolase-like isoform X1 [Myxocyprinus asiaticus]|uniref:lipid droplet-associated hydrolase-like isoform X1 n=1 Tax=Myxocyprinus asiaticus TaxID=70543 RepID=UPI002221FAC4|nr:lipid droplet-associated hydrolase-like isoform X1 [Myxocyprinus asiaticus]